MKTLNYDMVKAGYKAFNYPFREEKEFANLFGVRSKDLIVDQFNDALGVAYKDSFGNNQCLVFPGTTKPGLAYLKNEMANPGGTFIMAPGYYADCWMPGLHNGHAAYIQSGPDVFKGWRDKDMDGKLTMSGALYSDCLGVDGHTTRYDIDVNNVVDKFSAGCQVCWDDKHHAVWYNLGLRTLELFKLRKISYALFVE